MCFLLYREVLCCELKVQAPGELKKSLFRVALEDAGRVGARLVRREGAAAEGEQR